MEQYGKLRPEDAKESLRLSAFAFQFDLSEEELEQRQRQVKPEQVWACYADGRLAAKVHLLPLKTYIGGKPFLMGGIAGVATWPEHRRGGKIARLLGCCLEEMRAKGQTVSFLAPFSFAFYRKYGWEIYTEHKKYTIPTALLPVIKDSVGTIRRIGAEEWKLLQPLYEVYASRYNGSLCRDESWWKELISARAKGQIAVWFDNAGAPMGYLMYSVKNRELKADEMVYLNETARWQLWRFIGHHDSMIDRVVLKAPVDDPLPMLFDNPRFQQEIEPYFMARIVDLTAFIAQFDFASAGEARKLKLHVKDSSAVWNNGTFELTIDPSGHGRLIPLTEAKDEAPADANERSVTADIQTLTMLFLGYARPSLLQQTGRLDCPADLAARLDDWIPARTTYLMDFF
jgi:predicted acetyltransferase